MLSNGSTRPAYAWVTCAKPKSSRNSSIEAFVVCQGYRPPEGFEPRALRRVLEQRAGGMLREDAGSAMAGVMSWPNDVVVPFMACGDLSGYDADQSYDLPTYDDELVEESGGGGGGGGGGGAGEASPLDVGATHAGEAGQEECRRTPEDEGGEGGHLHVRNECGVSVGGGGRRHRGREKENEG